jgi:hypothetical protein
MKRSTFKRLHEVANKAANSGGLFTKSRTESGLLHIELGKEEQTLEVVEEEKEAEEVPFELFVDSSMFMKGHDYIKRTVEDRTNKILEGSRPHFFASWAHRSDYTSSVVREYSAVEYTHKIIYKSLMNVFCGIKSLIEKATIPSTDDNRLLLLDGSLKKHILHSHIRRCAGHDSALTLLKDVFLMQTMSINSLEPFDLRFDFADLGSTHNEEVDYMFNEYIYKMLKGNIKPKAIHGDYKFFIIDYTTLLLCLIYQKFPREFNILNEDELFIKTVEKTALKLRMDALPVIQNNVNTLFIWSDYAIKNKAMMYQNYKSAEFPMQNTNETSMEYIRAQKLKGASKKIDNKYYFNFDGFLQTQTSKLENRRLIEKMINL